MLLKILHNAVKYTTKGQVTLSINKFDDDSLSFQVDDTGIGINESHLNMLYANKENCDTSINDSEDVVSMRKIGFLIT